MAKSRQVLTGGGLPRHPQPFPTAVRVGSLVCSAGLGGHDPKTGKVPDAPEEQIRNAFTHAATVMQLAGGSLSDIAKVTVHLKDMGLRDLVNAEWVRIFPDEDDRPVRHSIEAPLGGNRVIQIEIMGMIEATGSGRS